jgi:hypothetical protein
LMREWRRKGGVGGLGVEGSRVIFVCVSCVVWRKYYWRWCERGVDVGGSLYWGGKGICFLFQMMIVCVGSISRFIGRITRFALIIDTYCHFEHV